MWAYEGTSTGCRCQRKGRLEGKKKGKGIHVGNDQVLGVRHARRGLGMAPRCSRQEGVAALGCVCMCVCVLLVCVVDVSVLWVWVSV